MCPELILWDWNGTLLDDVDLCVDALNRLLAGFGYPQRYDHERYRAIFGFPIEEYYVRALTRWRRLRPRGCGRSFCRPAIWTRCGVRPTSAA